MVTQILGFISQVPDISRFESLGAILPYLAKGSFYLLISRPLNWLALFRNDPINCVINNCHKERRVAMKGFSLYFSQIMFLTALLFILNGCYTTFQSARPYDDIDEDNYTSSYTPDADEMYYQGEEAPEYSESQLSLRPSRLMVEENYYGYNDYLRKVKYTVYDYDPWYDPYYYSSGYDRFSFYFHIGVSYPYYHHRPWFYPVYYQPPYYCWEPFITWYDPWYGNPGWYPYPVYYPIYVYYPYPVYDNPHHPTAPDREYNKRDWDKRQPVDGRRIASRTPSNSHQDPGAVTSNPGRIVKRSNTGSQKSRQNTGSQSGRTVVRKSDNSGRDSRIVEKKAPRNDIRSQNNSSGEIKEVKNRQIPPSSQKLAEKQIASSSISRESEIFRSPAKKQPAENSNRSNERVKNDNRNVEQNSGRISRPETRTETRPKETTNNNQSRPQTTEQPSAPKYTAPAKPESRSSYSSPAPSRSNSSEMRPQKSEPQKSDANKSNNSGRQNSSAGRKSR